MNSIGGLIFLLVIVAQGVAAVVAGIKKRQAEAAKAQQAQQAQQVRGARGGVSADATRQAPSNRAKAAGADPRLDVVSRRRRQIEELRRQAQERTAGRTIRTGKATEQPTAARRPFEPTARPATAKAPPRPATPPQAAPPVIDPAVLSNTPEARVKATASPVFEHTIGRGAPESGRSGAGSARRLAGALRSRRKLRELMVLKEVLDPPLALRSDDSSGRT